MFFAAAVALLWFESVKPMVTGSFGWELSTLAARSNERLCGRISTASSVTCRCVPQHLNQYIGDVVTGVSISALSLSLTSLRNLCVCLSVCLSVCLFVQVLCFQGCRWDADSVSYVFFRNNIFHPERLPPAQVRLVSRPKKLSSSEG